MDKNAPGPNQAKLPLVSVIMPCFNHGQYIREAIASVESQSFRNWELVIVDDCSTETFTRQILCELEAEGRKLLRLPANSGPSVARNRAIEAAQGEYILPLDADDKIAPSFIEKALAVFLASDGQEVRMVYSRARYFGAMDGEVPHVPYEFPKLLVQPMVFPVAMFRKSDWAKVGGYAENMRHAWEDYDFSIAMASLGGKTIQLDEPLFHYRQIHTGASRNSWVGTPARCAKLFATIYRNHRELYEQHMEVVFQTHVEAKLRMESLDRVLPSQFEWSVQDNADQTLQSGCWPKDRWVRLRVAIDAGSGRIKFFPFSQSGIFKIAGLQFWDGNRLLKSFTRHNLPAAVTPGGSIEHRNDGLCQSFGGDPHLWIDTSTAGAAVSHLSLWIRGACEPIHLAEALHCTAHAVHDRDQAQRLREEFKTRTEELEQLYLLELSRRRFGQAPGWLRSSLATRWGRQFWLRRAKPSEEVRSTHHEKGQVECHFTEAVRWLILVSPRTKTLLPPMNGDWRKFRFTPAEDSFCLLGQTETGQRHVVAGNCPEVP